MLVLLDSNIWLSELALSSSLGSATRFFLRQNKAEIILPEVVRLEVEHHLQTRLYGYKSDIEKAQRHLLGILGDMKEIVLPTDDAIDRKVRGVFSELGVSVREMPLTLEAARLSFDKILNTAPPSDKNQQFKDGAIWSVCVDLLTEDDVLFVTSDSAFYRERDVSKGLAAGLAKDLSNKTYSLKIFPTLTQLLPEIRINLTIPDESLLEPAVKQRPTYKNLLDQNSFSEPDIFRVSTKKYATEKPAHVFVEFHIFGDCSDQLGSRGNATLTIEGDGVYDTDNKCFVEISSNEESLSWEDETGEKVHKNIALAAATGTMGHRTVRHSVRASIDTV